MSRIAPEVWQRLDGARPTADYLTARFAAPGISERLLAGVDGEGQRHFLIALQPNQDSLHDAESRGLSVDTRELHPPDHPLGKYIDLVCREVAGHNAFDLIGAELAEGLAAGAIAPARLVARVLAKWRRFWGQVPRTLLSRESQLGLFAEIWFLQHWLMPATSSDTATRRWRGPFAARNDFEWPGHAVEVKSSTVVRGPLFRITGLDQLDPPGDGELFLFTLRLREDASAPHSLPSVVSECRAVLEGDGDALGRYETALIQAGYSPAHDADYAQTRWRIIDAKLYPVGSGFPRLCLASLSAGLPPGISEIAYTLDLGAYTGSVLLTPAEAAAALS